MMHPRILTSMRRFWRDETGGLTVEFVIIFPAIVMIFFTSLETTLLSIRSMMLERNLNKTVRDLRMSKLPADHDAILAHFCSRWTMIKDCNTSLLLEMRIVPQPAWSNPMSGARICQNRADPAVKMTNNETGSSGQVMLIRACTTVDVIFPFSGIGAGMKLDSNGDYNLVARSAFVVE
ncbi:MAG: TadE/TadG family type IV pilus assembly protein [Halocynthiibacter sp.]